MEKISNQNKEKSGENLENEFKINQEMEIQADILGISLEKLKAEINAMGGVEKFRELANEGLQSYTDEKGETKHHYSNLTKGEQALRNMVSGIYELRNFMGEKSIGFVTGVAGAGLTLTSSLEHTTSEDPAAKLAFVLGLLVLIFGTGGSILSTIKKKIEYNKKYLKGKIADMKLKMTGSVNRSHYLQSEPKEEKLREKVRKRQGKILTEEQEKNPSIDKFL